MTGIVEQDQPEGLYSKNSHDGFRGTLLRPWGAASSHGFPLHCSTLPKQSPSALDVSMSAPNDTAGTGAPTHPGIQWSKIVSRDALHTSIQYMLYRPSLKRISQGLKISAPLHRFEVGLRTVQRPTASQAALEEGRSLATICGIRAPLRSFA